MTRYSAPRFHYVLAAVAVAAVVVAFTLDASPPEGGDDATNFQKPLSSLPHKEQQQVTVFPSVLNSHGFGSATQGASLLPPISPVYYLDVEPKEQKYLRLGTDFEGMVRQVLRRREPEELPSESALALTHWQNPRKAPLAEAAKSLVLVHSDLAVANHLPQTTTSEFSRALVPVSYSDGQRQPSESQVEALRHKLSSMRVAQLRRMLRNLEIDKPTGGSCDGCVEKFHLVQRIMEIRGWNAEPTEDAVAWTLTVAQDSAGTRPLPHHLGLVPSPEENAAIGQAVMRAASIQMLLECGGPSYNGTVSCTQRRRTAAH